jgi:hypothetical protein
MNSTVSLVVGTCAEARRYWAFCTPSMSSTRIVAEGAVTFQPQHVTAEPQRAVHVVHGQPHADVHHRSSGGAAVRGVRAAAR